MRDRALTNQNTNGNREGNTEKKQIRQNNSDKTSDTEVSTLAGIKLEIERHK